MVYNWIEKCAVRALSPDLRPLRRRWRGGPRSLPRLRGRPAAQRQPLPPLREPLPPGAPAGTLCARCLRSPPAFDLCRAPYLYVPPADWLIGRLKFRAHLAYGRVLGALLADHLAGVDGPRPT